MHGVVMYCERRRSDGLGQKWVNFLWYLCAESLFVFNLLFLFYYLNSPFLFWLCPYLENQIIWFWFVVRFFCVLFVCVKA